ncbi:MAG: hypothetical protein ACLUD2_19505 [Clostridium sp.]
MALAAYAGAAIAKAGPMKTAFNASRLAIAAFIVPYIIAMNPAMLFINNHDPGGGHDHHQQHHWYFWCGSRLKRLCIP